MDFKYSSNFRKLSIQIAFLILLGFILVKFIHHFREDAPKLINDDIPDISFQNIEAYAYDLNGNLIHHFLAKTSEHYFKGDRVDFTYPILYFYKNKAEAPWRISSHYGQSRNAFNEIHLWDNVILFQKQSPFNKPSKLETSDLLYYPQNDIAKTAVFIKVTQPGVILSSEGLYADLKQNKINLLKKVQAYYEVSP